MAVKVVRQQKSIALLGAPTSAATLASGPERAPGALRAAGLSERLTAAGFAVTDYGDCKLHSFVVDDDHPRVRNSAQVLATLEELRPKVELAAKTGALLVVLGGDNSPLLGTLAGLRRYYKEVSLIYLDRDAGLNEPNTTPSGNVDGMVISHVIGRGAPELVRYWRDPPLVRPPNVALFGIERLDQPEEQFLATSPLRRYMAADIARLGVDKMAETALDRVHGRGSEFVLHIDLDVISSEDFAASNLSAPGGLRYEDVRRAVSLWARQPTLVAIQIGCYNPGLDPDGAKAKKLIELLVDALSPRLQPAAAGEQPAAEARSAEQPAPAPGAKVSESHPSAVPEATPEAAPAEEAAAPDADPLAAPSDPLTEPATEPPAVLPEPPSDFSSDPEE